MADDKLHARLLIFDLDVMLDHQRKRLVKWLRDKADEIEKCNPKDYDRKYTSRLFR